VAIGNCKIEELNKRKMGVLGLQHKDVQAFIQKEDNDCKRWNITQRVNKNMRAGLNYKKIGRLEKYFLTS
jgi:hypothetical protein